VSALGVLGIVAGVLVLAAAGAVALLWLLDADEHHACDCHPRYGVGK
jgi:hypothetical protein